MRCGWGVAKLPVLQSAPAPRSYERETQAYSTWGGKLLQHTDRLAEIQRDRVFRPITVQLAPTEACDSDCPFCSVQNRPVNKKIPWASVDKMLRDFRDLGAKSLEITGGGNPLLYRDGARNINDVVSLAADLGYRIGVITNSEHPKRHLTQQSLDALDWIRVSLIKLDEGKAPEDFDFEGIAPGQLGLSYIVYGSQYGKPGTTAESIEKIARVVELNPGVKFVRIASDCLTDESRTIKSEWGGVIEALDEHGKFFVKEIGEDDKPFDGGCWVGMLRPYAVWNGVYACTSHVLKHRNYRDGWRISGHLDVPESWARMNARFSAGLSPYEVDIPDCGHCYYSQSNRILHYVTADLPDRDFA